MPLLWGFLLFALASAAQARGYVHDLTGTVTVRSTPTAQERLRIGDIVEAGQTVVTEEGSSAVLKFEDGQVMALGARSSFVIRDYAYNKQQISASRAAFELLRGGLRFITGVIGSTNHNAVRINAGTSTIGIRGTDGTILFDASTQTVTAAVNAGAIAVSTPLGTQTVGAGTFTRASPGLRPAPAAPVAQAAAGVQQAVTALAQRSIPVNTPVVVEASARAVAAQALAAQQPANAQLQQQAAQALSEATAAAQAALQTAIQSGAVPPAPPAPAPGASGTPAPAPAAPATPAPSPAPPPAIPPTPRDTSASPN